MLNDARQKAVPGGWAKKYVVVEIPPFCRQRGGDDDDDDGEVGGRTEETSRESWSPMLTGSETDSGEAMDCSGGREEEEKRERGADTCPV